MSSEPNIHPTAIVDPSASIHPTVKIGPYSIIDANVVLGEGCVVKSHVTIGRDTTMGKDNVCQPYAAVGGDSQHRGCDPDEDSRLEVGDGNVFHSYCTINRGSEAGGGLTKVGNHNIFMAYTHVAHDCIIHDHVALVNNSTLGGHVEIFDHAGVGAFTMVHQFCRIGRYSYMPRGCKLPKDVLPFIIVSGEPAQPFGLNKVGLARAGFTEDDLAVLKRAYRIVFRENLTQTESAEQLKPLVAECQHVQTMIDMLESSDRGIIRY